MWATLLLVFMVVLYTVARSCLHMHDAWAWVRAFAEAGMIGALADWFAVVALFRHPMGIPIPHTAIVKSRKGKIGKSLGGFLRKNFLSPDLLKAQVVKYRVVPKAFQWLAQKDNSALIARALKDQILQVARNTDQDALHAKLADNLCQKLSTQPLEKNVGSWIGGVMHGQEFRRVLAPLLGKLAQGVEEQREWVEDNASATARESKSKLVTKITKSINRVVSGQVVNQVSAQLSGASENLDHTLYEKIETSLQELSTELQSEEENADWATWREQLLNSDRTRTTLAKILAQAGDLISEEQDRITNTLERSLSNFAQNTIDTPEEIAHWEGHLFRAIDTFSDQYAEGVEQLIIDRVNDWDADTLSDSMENSIGDDLQFIRINGTLIGGLIGLTLHGIGLLIWGH